SSEARQVHGSPVETLEGQGRQDSERHPLRRDADPEVAPIVGGGLQGSQTYRSEPAHTAAHAGYVADAGRDRRLGSRRLARNVGSYPHKSLREALSGLPIASG